MAEKQLTIVLSRPFKILFNLVLALTVLSMIGYSVIMAMDVVYHSEALIGITNTLLTIWKLGFGALIGMIGGKIL